MADKLREVWARLPKIEENQTAKEIENLQQKIELFEDQKTAELNETAQLIERLEKFMEKLTYLEKKQKQEQELNAKINQVH